MRPNWKATLFYPWRTLKTGDTHKKLFTILFAIGFGSVRSRQSDSSLLKISIFRPSTTQLTYTVLKHNRDNNSLNFLKENRKGNHEFKQQWIIKKEVTLLLGKLLKVYDRLKSLHPFQFMLKRKCYRRMNHLFTSLLVNSLCIFIVWLSEVTVNW
jgi:hypothetical protein